MRSSSINWKKGFFRLYVVASVLFLGSFAVFYAYEEATREFFIHSVPVCERLPVKLQYECQTFVPVIGVYTYQWPFPHWVPAFWEKFVGIFFVWIGLSIAAFISPIPVNWVLKGFNEDEVPKNEPAPSVNEDLVSKAQKIREDITDKS